MLIEKFEELNEKISVHVSNGANCILCVTDNKSQINVQYVVVKHPLDFVRNLNDFSKNLRLPVSDMDIKLIGYIGATNSLQPEEEEIIISPYVYFKKPDELSVNVGSYDSVPSTES